MMPVAHRKTRRRFEHLNEVRFLTCSCYHRLPLFGNDRIKDVFIEELAAARTGTVLRLIAYVVMPEHFHLLLIPALPQFTVSATLKDLKGAFANRVLRRWRRLDAPILAHLMDARGKPHFWQIGGGYDRNIHSGEEFEEKINYIHSNPVIRGLIEHTTDWRWSSARWYAGERGPDLLPIDMVSI